MKNPWILISGVFGFLGVALGAFGAHGLKESLTPDMLEIYKTGVLYHLIHSIAILAIGLYGNIKLFKSALFFSAGIVLFSFSLYVYSITSIKTLAMITPLGGVCFLIGWLILIIAAVKLRKES
jgi:uncharacterized membrane protein YgdD (TMEM256/DUF423 family)